MLTNFNSLIQKLLVKVVQFCWRLLGNKTSSNNQNKPVSTYICVTDLKRCHNVRLSDWHGHI